LFLRKKKEKIFFYIFFKEKIPLGDSCNFIISLFKIPSHLIIILKMFNSSPYFYLHF
jgi:hypothetical protein